MAEAARAAPPAPQPPRAADLLLDGLALLITEGYAAGAPPLQAGAAARSATRTCRSEDELRWLWLACRVAPDLWDDETLARAGQPRSVQLARDAGALTVLPLALTYRAGVHVHAGEFAAAAALIDEADAITRGDRQPRRCRTPRWCSPPGAAARPRRSQLIEASVAGRDRPRARDGPIASAEYATAVLYNGLGRYEDALAAAQRACEHDELGLFGWALAELVEAAARSGEPESRGRRARAARGANPRRAAPTGRSASRPARARC